MVCKQHVWDITKVSQLSMERTEEKMKEKLEMERRKWSHSKPS